MRQGGEIVNRIKELRTNAKMSQKDLAELVGVNQTAVSQWERGATSPKHFQVQKLCQVFQVSDAYLLGMIDIKNAPTPEEVSAMPEAQELRAVMESLSPEDRQRVLAFGRGLAATAQTPEEKK